MKLDDNGTAFFVEDINSEDSEDEDIPPELATSPIPQQSYMGMAAAAAGRPPPHFPAMAASEDAAMAASESGEGEGKKAANRSLIGEFNTIEEKESSAPEKEEEDDNVSSLCIGIRSGVESCFTSGIYSI